MGVRPPVRSVSNLAQAYDAYWAASTCREDQAAYHEILLFGGNDGHCFAEGWRAWAARVLRRLALKIEKR